MYIVSVIPLLPGISKDTLTYSSERALSLGSVISCPFRNKTIDCIVIERRTIREAKSDLRSANFVIKKINPKAKQRNLISKDYVESLTNISHYYGIAYSECFSLMLPKSLYSSDLTLPKSPERVSKKIDVQYLEIPNSQTINYYKNQAENGLRIIVAPTKERVKKLSVALHEDKPILLHSGISVKKQKDTFEEISCEDSKLYICTPQFISFFKDVETVYMDNFSSSHYVTTISPYIDTRLALKDYCTRIANSVVAIDSLILEKSESVPEFDFKLIDMTDSANGSKYIWQSAYLEKLLGHNKSHSKKTLLYVHRKGLSSYLSCNDCRSVVTCSCSTPFTLKEETDGTRKLKCSSCKKLLSLDSQYPIACNTCGSWKLEGYGIGASLVYDDLVKMGWPAFVIDSDHTKTPKEISDIYSKFADTPGGILVSTELGGDYFDGAIDSVCVVSIDSLLLMPDYNTDAQVLRRIISLSSYSSTALCVQTRLPKQDVLQVQNTKAYQSWKDQYTNELSEYFLPPFGVFVKISKKGYFTDKEKDIIDAAFKGQNYTHSSFRSFSFVTTRIKLELWNDQQSFLPYKISLLRSTCDVFIQ